MLRTGTLSTALHSDSFWRGWRNVHRTPTRLTTRWRRYKRNNSSTAHGYSCVDVFHCTAMRCYGETFECGFHSQYQDTSYINGMLPCTTFFIP